MKTEIIAVGTELLLGQIVNTNAAYISEQLNAIGFPVYYHSVVGDNPDRLRQQLEIAGERSVLIILTGGLGPTKDDLTKEVVARFLGVDMKVDDQALRNVERFFRKRNMTMSANNRRQAEVLEGATVFPNDHGLAAGMAVQQKGICLVLLPGPPSEMQPMFTTYAVPFLRGLQKVPTVVHSRVMRFCGIGESLLEETIQDLIDAQDNPTIAPLAKQGEVTLRITSMAQDREAAERMMQPVIRMIQDRVGTYQYGWDEDSLERVVVRLLHESERTLSAAESCTGGLVSYSLSTVPGASKVFTGSVVCYTNEVKQRAAGLPQETIDREGVVSKAASKQLAEGIRDRFGTSIGLSVTGVAGPDRQEGKPAGLVYIGLAMDGRTVAHKVHLAGTRNMIQVRAAKLALFYLWRALIRNGPDGEK